MTSVGSGIGSTLGTAIESTYGTAVTPTKWVEYENESLSWMPQRTTGKGLYGGVGVSRGSNHLTTTAMAGGTVKTPMYFKGMGQWLGSLMGSLNVAPVQQAATIAYLQTHALNVNNLGQSLTIQKGVPNLLGTVDPYTIIGGKVTQAQFEIAVDQFAYANFTVDGKDVIQATSVITGAPTLAYGAPTYQTSNPPFAWQQGIFSMGTYGAEAAVSGVTKATINIKRGYAEKRFYLDGTGRKAEPVSNAFIEISGTLETDYIDKTKFTDIFANNGSQSMILTFTGPTAIATTYFPTFTIALPQVFFMGETPKVGGPEIIKPSISFTALYDDTHTPATLSLITPDTTL